MADTCPGMHIGDLNALSPIQSSPSLPTNSLLMSYPEPKSSNPFYSRSAHLSSSNSSMSPWARSNTPLPPTDDSDAFDFIQDSHSASPPVSSNSSNRGISQVFGHGMPSYQVNHASDRYLPSLTREYHIPGSQVRVQWGSIACLFPDLTSFAPRTPLLFLTQLTRQIMRSLFGLEISHIGSSMTSF